MLRVEAVKDSETPHRKRATDETQRGRRLGPADGRDSASAPGISASRMALKRRPRRPSLQLGIFLIGA